jgi:NADH-quinone oxidoreductase subunit E
MTEITKPIITLSDVAKTKIDHWIAKFPADKKQSAVIPALHIVQDENGGWLPQALLDCVADYLEMSPVAVYEVATFYSMFELQPTGKYVINVCTNVSCMLAGAEDIMAHIKKRFNIKCNDTSADGLFTLREVECLAACAAAPAMMLEKKYHENLTPEKVDTILDALEGDHVK